MKKRLFIYTTLTIIAALLCFFAASVYIAYNNNLRIAKDTVMETARIVANLYDRESDASAFVKAGGDTRITLISPGGEVIADSRPLDIGTVENHLSRPEIQAAQSDAPAAYVRRSESLGIDMIYYAVKADSGDSFVFIRTAIPVEKIDAYLAQTLPVLIIVLIVVILLCFALSRVMINRITRPFESVGQKLRLLSDGQYNPEPFAKSYEEIDAITRGIDEVAQILRDSFASLQNEKSKVEYILNNIGDGIFAVDENMNITLINTAALDIFDATPEISGKNINYLTYENALTTAVNDCATQEKSALFELTSGGRIYLATVKRLPATSLTMVILSDITESRGNAKRREDFFANASHELKTPLTAIKGFNELTAINNKDTNIDKYIESISRETDRMLSLIGDMLKLSELENTQEINPVPVSLAQVVNEVRETLSTAISDKAVALDVAGDAIIEAEPGHVYELIKNLLENAVRYNNQNGRVSVTVESDRSGGSGGSGRSGGSGGSGGSGRSGGNGESNRGEKSAQTGAILCINDDGIGISPGEQTRIFERFYRVEKSRSQRSGGTGLGLSIVKHICTLNGWELSLKSKPGVGTEIKVIFGKRL